MTPEVSVVKGDVVVRDTETGRVLWSGRPARAEVREAVAGLGDTVVVLMDWTRTDGSNVFCVQFDGLTKWVAAFPSFRGKDGCENDCYTSVNWREGKLRAYLSSGWSCTLDPKSGRVLETTFVK